MLDWYEHLYIGDTVKRKIKKYKNKLDKKKTVPDIFLITLSSNDVDQLEIINSFFLLQEVVYQRCPLIVGIAKGYEEACELVIQMTEDTVAYTGSANIKEYLLRR